MNPMKASPLTDKFIQDLKDKLDKNKIHKVKFAKQLCVSRVVLYRWLMRRSNPSSEYLLKIQNKINNL